jgi:hypothetical protein
MLLHQEEYHFRESHSRAEEVITCHTTSFSVAFSLLPVKPYQYPFLYYEENERKYGNIRVAC